MSQQYFTILTEAGAAAEANAKALGQSLQLAQFAVGDGGGADYDPDVETLKSSTALENETYRGAINELAIDPDNSARYYAEGVVPVAVGGWTVREAGWFLSDGTLYAVTKYPPSYKSVPADGVSTELPVRTYIAVGNTDTVTLTIDPTVVLATRDYVDSRFKWRELASNANLLPGHSHLLMAPITVTLPADGGLPVVVEGDLDSGITAETPATVNVEGGAAIKTRKGDFTEFVITTTKVAWRFHFVNGAWTL